MAEVSVATTIARGAMAGAAATVPMTAVFVAARAVGAIDEFPPVQIVARVVGLRRSRRHPVAVRRWAMIALLPPAHRENRRRTAAIGLAHVVWGTALARLLSPRP